MHAEERPERVGETADRMGDTVDGTFQPERMMEPERIAPEHPMESAPEHSMESERLDAHTEPPAGSSPTDDGDRELAVELLGREDVAKFRTGWQEVQTRFVDDPKAAVRDADRLVGDVTRSLTATFSERKQELENAWQQGSTVETEDLRQALRRYRSFFDRLLNV